MKKLFNTALSTALASLFAITLALPTDALAHCDTMNGPVVIEARKALAAGDVTPLLKWIAADDEAEIRGAFDRTVKLRAHADAEVRDMADMYFLETFVRLHRMSEGVGYTGIKDAEVAPLIAAADRSLESGSVDHLTDHLVEHLRHVLQERFEAALEAKAHADHSVEAGREYVHNYVLYTHLVEELDHLIQHAAEAGHGAAAAHAH